MTFLVAMKSNGSGVEVRTLFPENHDSHGASQRPGHGLKPQMLFISGHNLSSECGEQYFRCQEVLVDTVLVQGDGGVLNIVFVPLEKGILLLHYWYDSNTLTLTTEWNIYSSDCSPIVFFKISNKVFVVCISSYQYLAVYEIQVKLSGSIIEDMIHLGPLMNVNISNLSSSLSLSNFVVFEHMIYFTVGNTIVVMDVFDSTRSHQHQTLPGCTQIYKIIPTTGVGGQQLLVAYCIHKYDYFDLQYGDWTDLYPFSSNGVPYICPDNNYRATLFTNSTLQFSVRGSILNTINNVSISSGVCFESQNKTYFAYSDQQHNYIYVYDFIAQDHYPVSPYDCSHVHQDCPQLLTLGNEYLVVRDADCNYVLDIATDFNLLINISSGITDILAIVHSNVHSAITPSPPIVHSTASEIVPQSMGFTISITTFAYDATLSRPATITLLAHSIDSSIITPTGSPGNFPWPHSP